MIDSDESAHALLSFKNGGMKFDPELEMRMETVEDVLGPLGLCRVGHEPKPKPKTSQPELVLNRRGMVRKRHGYNIVLLTLLLT